MARLFAARRALLAHEEKITNMAAIGQTLCQVEKTYSNQWLEQVFSGRAGVLAPKQLKTAQFVAKQRQGMSQMRNYRYKSMA